MTLFGPQTAYAVKILSEYCKNTVCTAKNKFVRDCLKRQHKTGQSDDRIVRKQKQNMDRLKNKDLKNVLVPAARCAAQAHKKAPE